jgi:hypothetical protein
VKGQPRAAPPAGVAAPATRTTLTVAWAGGSTRALAVVTGPGHWYRRGDALVEVRWGAVPEGPGRPRDESCVPTEVTMPPPPIVACSTHRWSLETTVQDGREDVQRESTQGDRPPPV